MTPLQEHPVHQTPGVYYGLMRSRPLSSQPVGRVDEHKGVIDHHAGQSHHPEETDKAQVEAHQEMPCYRAHKAKRDGNHDNRGLGEGLERDCKQGTDAEKGDDEAINNVRHGFLLILAAAIR
jgi:hypothetical protein